MLRATAQVRQELSVRLGSAALQRAWAAGAELSPTKTVALARAAQPRGSARGTRLSVRAGGRGTVRPRPSRQQGTATPVRRDE
jgi:hypothetical protein